MWVDQKHDFSRRPTMGNSASLSGGQRRELPRPERLPVSCWGSSSPAYSDMCSQLGSFVLRQLGGRPPASSLSSARCSLMKLHVISSSN